MLKNFLKSPITLKKIKKCLKTSEIPNNSNNTRLTSAQFASPSTPTLILTLPSTAPTLSTNTASSWATTKACPLTSTALVTTPSKASSSKATQTNPSSSAASPAQGKRRPPNWWSTTFPPSLAPPAVLSSFSSSKTPFGHSSTIQQQ